MKKLFISFGLAAVLFSIYGCRSLEVIAQRLATATPRPTARPTFTPLPTITPTRTATRRPTLRPNTVAPTVPPTTTPTRPPFDFRVDSVRCYHSGQSFLEGLILENTDAHSGINGVLVRMSTQPGGSPAAPDYPTEEHGLSDARFRGSFNGYFWFGVNAAGHAEGQVRYVWVVDSSGQPLSDPNDPKARAPFNKLGSENPNACWNVQIVFVKIQ